MSEEDPQLIRRSIEGDRRAFEALYAAHARRIVAYFRRSGFAPADADDLTQEVFIRVYKALGGFDAARGGFRAWLAAIARNVARKQWSRRSGGENFDPALAEEIFAAAENPGETPEAREEIAAVRACVETLPDELAQIVRLRYVDGRTTRGVAAAMEMPEATVRLRLGQARELLARCLRAKGILE